MTCIPTGLSFLLELFNVLFVLCCPMLLPSETVDVDLIFDFDAIRVGGSGQAVAPDGLPSLQGVASAAYVWEGEGAGQPVGGDGGEGRGEAGERGD